ncbi:hypothetical protein [Aeromonas media]
MTDGQEGSATTRTMSIPYYLDDDCLLVGAQIFVNLATKAA